MSSLGISHSVGDHGHFAFHKTQFSKTPSAGPDKARLMEEVKEVMPTYKMKRIVNRSFPVLDEMSRKPSLVMEISLK